MNFIIINMGLINTTTTTSITTTSTTTNLYLLIPFIATTPTTHQVTILQMYYGYFIIIIIAIARLIIIMDLLGYFIEEFVGYSIDFIIFIFRINIFQHINRSFTGGLDYKSNIVVSLFFYICFLSEYYMYTYLSLPQIS